MFRPISPHFRGLHKSIFRQLSKPSKNLKPKLPALITMAEAKKMPKRLKDMPNDIILNMAVNGVLEAKVERLIREIMSTDNVTWEEADKIFAKMVIANRKDIFLATLPYKLGICTALFAGFASFPLIFDYTAVGWFNDTFVTSDRPDEKDLETAFEVGSWAWNWMEPPIGQVSFFLLCMQFARAQMENLGVKPYTAYYKSHRAKRLCMEFPNYDEDIVVDFSSSDPFNAPQYSNDH